MPHMVENAGMKIPLRPPGKVPHPFRMQNPDGKDAAAARDAAAAATTRDATARDTAAAGDGEHRPNLNQLDWGTPGRKPRSHDKRTDI